MSKTLLNSQLLLLVGLAACGGSGGGGGTGGLTPSQQLVLNSIQDVQGSFTPTTGICNGQPDGNVGGDGVARTLVINGLTWKEIESTVTYTLDNQINTTNTTETDATILSRNNNAQTITIQFTSQTSTWSAPGVSPDVTTTSLAGVPVTTIKYASINSSGAVLSMVSDSSQQDDFLRVLDASCPSYTVNLKRN